VSPLIASGVSRSSPARAFFAADVGVSGSDYLIAETGTIVLSTRPDQPRSPACAPGPHRRRERRAVIPDLFDLFDGRARPELPACCR
jgi:hypothetical protein